MTYRLTTALPLALLFPATAPAQSIFELDEIIFSAGLTPVEEDSVGVSVDVVTEEDLRAAGNIQLSDYLATLPGISVAQTGPIGSVTTLRVRGLGGQYLPVYVNGINLTDLSSPQATFDFGALNTGSLSRIEILRGSQSAIYGSEAIGGVINITTLQPPQTQGTEGAIELEAGSFGTAMGSVQIGSRTDRATLAFSATRLVTDGFSAADENLGNTEADGHRSTTLAFTGTYDLTDTVTVGASLLQIDSFSEFDAGGGAGRDGQQTEDAMRRGARIFAQIDGAWLDQEFAASTARTDRFYPIGFTNLFESDRLDLSWRGSIDLAGDDSLVIGLDRSFEEFRTETLAPASVTTGRVDVTSLYAEYLTALGPDVDLSLALRRDEHSRFGGATTGRVALAWRAAPDTLVRASYSTGFRAPSLFELFSSFGNPNLLPEESRSLEFGITQDFGNLSLTATVFLTEIDNLIDFAGASYNQVPGTSRQRGIELAADYAITPELMLFGNYAYIDSRDRNGRRLVRVPYHDVTLGLTGQITDRVSGTFTIQHVADRLDSRFPLIVAMPDYTLANMQVGYALNDDIDLYLRVENVFDEQYQLVDGFGTSDQAVYIGLRSRF